MTPTLPDIIKSIRAREPRYDPAAYYFLYEALEHTMGKSGAKGHVTGKQLLEGIREYGLQKFGLMAKTVFNQWGIHKTDDFGEVVFQLVDNNAMGKTESDSKDDFKGVYDFETAFRDLKHLSKEWKIRE